MHLPEVFKYAKFKLESYCISTSENGYELLESCNIYINNILMNVTEVKVPKYKGIDEKIKTRLESGEEMVVVFNANRYKLKIVEEWVYMELEP